MKFFSGTSARAIASCAGICSLRRLLQPQRLTQDREDDDDPGEAGHQHDERRDEAQRRHDQQDLQTDRILLLPLGIGGQGDRRDRQRIVALRQDAGRLLRHGQRADQHQRGQQQNAQHQGLSL